jgi:hypothetical protein
MFVAVTGCNMFRPVRAREMSTTQRFAPYDPENNNSIRNFENADVLDAEEVNAKLTRRAKRELAFTGKQGDTDFSKEFKKTISMTKKKTRRGRGRSFVSRFLSTHLVAVKAIRKAKNNGRGSTIFNRLGQVESVKRTKTKTILQAQSFDEDLENEMNGVEEEEDMCNDKNGDGKERRRKKKKKTGSPEEGGVEDGQEDATGGKGDARMFKNPLDSLGALDAMRQSDDPEAGETDDDADDADV